MAFPDWSTAAQNDADGHDTELSDPAGSMLGQVGLPLLERSVALDVRNTTQSLLEKHEMPAYSLISTGVDHAFPSNVAVSWAPVTIPQNEVEKHDTAVGGPSGLPMNGVGKSA